MRKEGFRLGGKVALETVGVGRMPTQARGDSSGEVTIFNSRTFTKYLRLPNQEGTIGTGTVWGGGCSEATRQVLSQIHCQLDYCRLYEACKEASHGINLGEGVVPAHSCL